MAFWALRSFEAATIFMALVICCVDFTDAILVLTSLRFGIYLLIVLSSMN